VAEELRGPAWRYYHDWLPAELLTTVQARELNPEAFASLTGAYFENHEEIDDWLRTVWPTSFSEPYPGSSI
jgi:hypothetical protein